MHEQSFTFDIDAGKHTEVVVAVIECVRVTDIRSHRNICTGKARSDADNSEQCTECTD